MRKHSRMRWLVVHEHDDEVVTVTPVQLDRRGPVELILFAGDGETPSRATWRLLRTRAQVLWVDVGQA